MRLSEEDARALANLAADDTTFNILEYSDMDPAEYERVNDDIADGYTRVLKAVELP